ncbi:MAG: hypothetical protein A2161_05915 [Candidatus Schekmanbacteria bacterium RBG_13_48_7]|uniref:PIN domain-containing protein n=1 Tax=Candidatus Schekmanbacteria bacterium RBG_13_48_7 TaxID=1817878 RepID=A0A1F7RSL0_9BACT|nr:MAG: hypothetical protein A2161_05915 [Candidatus Schekmanbacteria bacterium RBG_13_48_7]
MKEKTFLDTNIFIYSIDTSPDEKNKSKRSQQIVKEHIANESGVISIQILQEFYQVATRKIQKPISTKEALEYLRYMSILEILYPDFNMIVSAIHLHEKHLISFWDGMILQAAATAGCTVLLTEDLQDGFCLENLKVVNPFV